jgi:hypothetical protein
MKVVGIKDAKKKYPLVTHQYRSPSIETWQKFHIEIMVKREEVPNEITFRASRESTEPSPIAPLIEMSLNFFRALTV